MIGFYAGGWLRDVYGWRVAFLTVGLPGLLLAAIVRVTLKEPLRGLSEGHAAQDEAEAPSVGESFRFFLGNRTLRHIALGSALNAFVGYGAVNWFPTFLRRSYDMSGTDVGETLALIIGLGGGLGTFLAGYFADRLSSRDLRWNMWLPTALFVGTFPFTFGVYLSYDASTTLWFYVIPAMMGTVYLAPSLAMVQGLVPLRLRTTASAILLFIINIIGMGLGPQMVGLLSDWLAEEHGLESIRYALFASSFFLIWSGAHFMIASRSLREDLARARERAEMA